MAGASATVLPPYTYAPLRVKDSIRLLRLGPARNLHEPITCSLGVYTLDNDIVPYTALSYSWGRNKDGDASLSHSITIDGQTLSITESLCRALNRLRSNADDQYLLVWVDAICINQVDIAERNAQVAMMSQMYANATTIIVWLGEQESCDDEDRLAHETLLAARPPMTTIPPRCRLEQPAPSADLFANFKSTLRNIIHSSLLTDASHHDGGKKVHQAAPLDTSDVKRTIEGTGDYVTLTKLTKRDLHLELLHCAYYSDEPLYSAMRGEYADRFTRIIVARLNATGELLRRRYFSRRWVLQELYQSMAPTYIQWAQYRMTLEDFVARTMTLRKLLDHCADQRLGKGRSHEPEELIEAEKAVSATVAPVLKTLGVRTIRSREGSWSPRRSLLLHCLNEFRDHRCTDERDIIFAFASMSEGSTKVIPDYSLSCSAAFISLSKTLALNGEIDFLFKVAVRQRHGSSNLEPPADKWHDDELSAALPSWSPDFRLRLRNPLPSEYDAIDAEYCRRIVRVADVRQEYHPQMVVTRTIPLGLRLRLARLRQATEGESQSIARILYPKATANLNQNSTSFSGHFAEFPSGFAVPVRECEDGDARLGDVLCCYESSRDAWSYFVLRHLPERASCFTLVGCYRLDSKDPFLSVRSGIRSSEWAKPIKNEPISDIWLY